MNGLPAGYMVLGKDGPAIHVAQLRKMTSDLERFKGFLPLALEVGDMEPGTPEWVAFAERHIDYLPQIRATLIELGQIQVACAEEMLRIVAQRQGGAA
jgi:hypothetical protein